MYIYILYIILYYITLYYIILYYIIYIKKYIYIYIHCIYLHLTRSALQKTETSLATYEEKNLWDFSRRNSFSVCAQAPRKTEGYQGSAALKQQWELALTALDRDNWGNWAKKDQKGSKRYQIGHAMYSIASIAVDKQAKTNYKESSKTKVRDIQNFNPPSTQVISSPCIPCLGRKCFVISLGPPKFITDRTHLLTTKGLQRL